MNTLENIINEHDYLMDPDDDGVVVKLAEDLGSGGGSGESPVDEKMIGIDPGLLESSNDAIIVNNDVELLRFHFLVHKEIPIFFLFFSAKWTRTATIKGQTNPPDFHCSLREEKLILKRSTTQPVNFHQLVTLYCFFF